MRFSEKYRPKKLDDMVLPETIKNILANKLAKKNIQNITLSGSAGTGKTTLAHVIANEIQGKAKGTDFLELNASDERRIADIRGKVKSFIGTGSLGGKIKILLLDEADSLTKDAQTALRRMIEKTSCITILTCNYKNKLIDPILSRTFLIELGSFPKEALKNRILFVCREEKIKISTQALEHLMTFNDLRKIMNTLEALKDSKDMITKTMLLRFYNAEEATKIEDILFPKFAKLNYFLVHKKIKEQMNNGTSPEELVKQMRFYILKNKRIPEEKKPEIMEHSAVTLQRIIQGVDRETAVTAFVFKTVQSCQ